MKLPHSFRKKTGVPAAGPLQAEVRRAAERFAAWADERLEGRTVGFTTGDVAAAEQLIVREAEKIPAGTPMPEMLASDFAAFLGEVVRQDWQGDWAEDELLGIVLRDLDGQPALRLVPLAMAEKKWELRAGLALAEFFENLTARLDVERKSLTYQVAPHPSREQIIARLSETKAGEELPFAQLHVQSLSEWWKARFGVALPLTLQGIREMERFLRSQFFLFSLHEETLVQMGFFLGEVARGLFQGTWSFDDVRKLQDPTRVALVWPELPYYPIGKIYKFMTERPERETLAGYLSLIPSARQELRKKGGV